MKKIVLSLIAISIVLLATLATPTEATFDTRRDVEMYGSLWDNPAGAYELRHQGIYGETYISRQDTNGTIYKEFVAIHDWTLQQWYFLYVTWMSVGYYHYKGNTPLQFVRWRTSEYDLIHQRSKGYISYDRYQNYQVNMAGVYWQAWIGGQKVEQIYLPLDEAAIMSEMSSTQNVGDLYGYWRYMKEYHNGQWTYWDWQTPSYNFDVVVYIINQHTWGCYNSL